MWNGLLMTNKIPPKDLEKESQLSPKLVNFCLEKLCYNTFHKPL